MYETSSSLTNTEGFLLVLANTRSKLGQSSCDPTVIPQRTTGFKYWLLV